MFCDLDLLATHAKRKGVKPADFTLLKFLRQSTGDLVLGSMVPCPGRRDQI